MKRDMDLIREILLRLEESGEGEQTYQPISDIGYSRERIRYHNYLLVDAGLAIGFDLGSDGTPLPQAATDALTWEGHEFLDAARDDNRWSRAKSVLAEVKGFSFAVLKELLIGMIRQEAQAQV